MTDDDIARLRELADESLRTVAARFSLALEGPAVLALLDERDALRAMLREARDYVNAYPAHPETDDVLNRIDALLGGSND
jgi:hypothetical protein